MIELTFLGTTCMVPTKERNHPGLFLSYREEGLLIDCGEGIQRQFKIAGIKLTKVTRILITHWHGDHVLGLPGLIQSMASQEYEGRLEIYGPKGIKKRMAAMMEAFIFDKSIDMRVTEVREGVFVDTTQFSLEAFPLEHGIPTLGYRFCEKDRLRVKMAELTRRGIPEGPHIGKLSSGKDIVYDKKKVSYKDVTYLVPGKVIGVIADTSLCDQCYAIANHADILVSEASFTSAHEDKAAEYRHLTAGQAAMVASQSGVGRLILTHFSPRYKDVAEIEEDAKAVFSDVTLAYDFLKIKL